MPFCFEEIQFFIFHGVHGGFLQITPFIKRLQGSFLLGQKVQGSLDMCVKFLANWPT